MSDLSKHPAVLKAEAEGAPTTPGQFIRACREHYGMTQNELADKMNKGQNSISRYESDLALPDTPSVYVLFAALNWTPEQLVHFFKLVAITRGI